MIGRCKKNRKVKFSTLYVSSSSHWRRNWIEPRKKKSNTREYLSEDLLGQIGALEEGNGLTSTDPTVPIRICSPKVRIE